MTKYLILLIFICGMSGCYNQRKATTQFSKAVIAYPKIGSDYCANEFPVHDSTITDTLLTTDTLYIEGQDLTDTVRINDTVRITVTRTLPAKIITNTVHIRDTIYQTNTAALKSCEIDNSKLIELTNKQAADIEKYKGQANKRGWMFWGLVFLVVGYTAARIYSKSKKISI